MSDPMYDYRSSGGFTHDGPLPLMPDPSLPPSGPVWNTRYAIALVVAAVGAAVTRLAAAFYSLSDLRLGEHFEASPDRAVREADLATLQAHVTPEHTWWMIGLITGLAMLVIYRVWRRQLRLVSAWPVVKRTAAARVWLVSYLALVVLGFAASLQNHTTLDQILAAQRSAVYYYLAAAVFALANVWIAYQIRKVAGLLLSGRMPVPPVTGDRLAGQTPEAPEWSAAG